MADDLLGELGAESNEQRARKKRRPENPDKPLGALVISVSQPDEGERRRKRLSSMSPEVAEDAQAGFRTGQLDPQDQEAAAGGREAGVEMEEFLAGLDEGQRAILLRKLQQDG